MPGNGVLKLLETSVLAWFLTKTHAKTKCYFNGGFTQYCMLRALGYPNHTSRTISKPASELRRWMMMDLPLSSSSRITEESMSR